MFRRIVFVLLAVAFIPVADGLAAPNGKAGKKRNCLAAAQANCPAYGVAKKNCVQAAVARCRKSGR